MSASFLLLRRSRYISTKPRSERADVHEYVSIWATEAEATPEGRDRLRFFSERFDALVSGRIGFALDRNIVTQEDHVFVHMPDEDAVAWRLEFGDEPIKSLFG